MDRIRTPVTKIQITGNPQIKTKGTTNTTTIIKVMTWETTATIKVPVTTGKCRRVTTRRSTIHQ
jgi:hypothetical protein